MSNIETIVAIATPLGRGGVGVVRISGPQSLDLAKKITHKESFVVREALFTKFYDGDKVIDEGLTIYFKAPNSFTGEDVVELQSHGSPIVLDQLVKTGIDCGARMARPGEFSERAFLNNKIDLTQAEAIADLIAASSQEAAHSAQRSLQGEFSKLIHALVEQVIHLRMYVEASIDFAEEEIDFLSDGRIQNDLEKIIQTVLDILSRANQGVLLTQGIQVVIAGKPNAGKSSLLNLLSERESAIVTDVPGTTRDVLRESIQIDGMPLHIIDTAGLRVTDDVVEKEGIKRAWNEIGKADVVLLLIDASREKFIEEEWKELLANTENKKLMLIYNKIDLLREPPHMVCHASEHSVIPDSTQRVRDPGSIIEIVNSTFPFTQICLSTKTREGLDELKQALKKLVGFQTTENTFSARRRHVDALEKSLKHLRLGEQQLLEQKAGELLAEELRLVQQNLSEITGEFSSDDLLGRIFSSFCVGK